MLGCATRVTRERAPSAVIPGSRRGDEEIDLSLSCRLPIGSPSLSCGGDVPYRQAAYTTLAQGNPIAYSALVLRDDLAYAREKYGFGRVTLIGHSMGGILSRLQVTNSRKVIWDNVFGAKADQLDAQLPADSIVKRALIFQANPAVKRIIFVSTPHRGSALASGGIGALGARLIRLPFKLVSAVPKTVFAALAPNSDPNKARPPTSISGLSPKNPVLLAMDKLPIEAPHNSIIGDRGRGDTPNSSDGVVPYWSSHLDSAQSEVIVPTDHGAMKSPKAVAEIHRILLAETAK